MGPIIVLLFFIGMIAFGGKVLSMLRNLGRWNRTYQRLSQRYAGKQSTGGVLYGYLLTNPGLMFDYGRTFCVLKNRTSLRFSEGRQTELGMSWPDKRLRIEISTQPIHASGWGKSSLKPVSLNSRFHSRFYLSSNQPAVAEEMLSSSVQWQLEKLRLLTGNEQLLVSLQRGQLLIAKPGYIKEFQLLDDFVRYSLDLFDQLMLSVAEGIEFLHEDQAAIVAEVKCPICSEQVGQNMVVCQRCKTPHCLDCWQYNGQCATFACSETRYVRVGKKANLEINPASVSLNARAMD